MVEASTVLQENDELFYFVSESQREAVASRLARNFKE